MFCGSLLFRDGMIGEFFQRLDHGRVIPGLAPASHTGVEHLLRAVERHPIARLDPLPLLPAARGEVVTPHDDVLGRGDDRVAVGRAKNVVGRHQERVGLDLGLDRQRQMHSHLVAVEVRVEGRADQRVNLDGLAFHQHRLERLNTQAVERRSAVQKNRMFTNDFFENIKE